MSAHAAPTERAGLGVAPRLSPRARGLSLPRVSATSWAALGLGTTLAAIAFVASGGLSLSSATGVEMALTVAGGAAVAGVTIARPDAGPVRGAWPAALLLGLAVLCAVSVVWSAAPDTSWQEASRTLAYAASFALALSWVRAAPGRWPAVLGGVVLAAVVVSGYALATKVLPAQLNANEIYARLREPYGYWNAIGLTAALGIPATLWLGARRSGHRSLNALAYPATGLLLVTLLFAYSRGALLALGVGLALWFTAVPLRLRSAAVLLTAAAGAVVVVLWAFSQHALTTDRVALGERSAAGHQFGVLLIAMLVALLAAGLALSFATDRRPPPERMRRQAGIALLVALALVPVGVAGALAASHRGLFGSISHAATSLTDPHARVPANNPSRLTAIGNVRARYWNDALKAFKDHAVLGTGAGGYATARLRYRQDTLNVQHAHGYVVQTVADLGLLGLGVTLALLAAWLAAALRSTRVYGLRLERSAPGAWRPGVLRALPAGRVVRAAEPFTPERVGLATMLTVVVVFGVHSLVDWTWFVPGNAVVALLCAGWLAGRGPSAAAGSGPASDQGSGPGGGAGAERVVQPGGGAGGGTALRSREGEVIGRAGRVRLAAAAAIVAVTLIAAWAEWQPLRAVNALNDAGAAVDRHDLVGAQASLRTAISRDPVSVDPLFALAAVQSAAGQRPAAHTTLIRAIRLQPSNPQTWAELAGFDLYTANDARSALNDLRAALYLDPQNVDYQSEFVAALRRANPSTPVTAAVPPVAPSNPGPVGPSG